VRRFLVILLVSTLFAAVAPAAPVPKHLMKDPVYYFPLRVGTKWVYTDPEGEETLVISGIEVVDGSRIVTVERQGNGKAVVWEKMAVSARGLSRVEGLGGKLDPPLEMLRTPAVVGNKWEFKTTGVDGTDSIGAIEQLKVPAGTFEAVRVDAVYSLGGSEQKTTFWYARNVGLVKMDYNGGKERVLKSFTPGKE
jgi:hypothetical protein